jgi:hypothetical protein
MPPGFKSAVKLSPFQEKGPAQSAPAQRFNPVRRTYAPAVAAVAAAEAGSSCLPEPSFRPGK